VTVSILVVDDESDVAALYRQRFRREVRQGTYATDFANSGEDALDKLAGGVEPTLIAILSDINMPGNGTSGGGVSVKWFAEFIIKPVDFEPLRV
jgi:CheY-like chemotaxis protein